MASSITKGETYKELTASEITGDALIILQTRNVKAWRQSNNSFRRRANIVKYSIPDILGHNRSTGIMVGCEVKKNGDVLSTDQIDFLIELHESGGIALVAHQVRDKTVISDFVDYYTKYKHK